MIKDSGERREFETGAVRDMAEGKGRFDLMPLSEMANLFGKDTRLYSIIMDLSYMLDYESKCSESNCPDPFATNAIYNFIAYCKNKDFEDVTLSDVAEYMLEVAVRFEEGAKKYGEHNWEKGLPLNSYIDSATRHLMKHISGMTDERHDRAFIWNLLAYAYTVNHQ